MNRFGILSEQAFFFRAFQASKCEYILESIPSYGKQVYSKSLFTWRWGTPGKWSNSLWWGKPPLHIISYSGHLTYHVNVIKLKWEIMWTGGLPTKAGYLTYLGSPTLM